MAPIETEMAARNEQVFDLVKTLTELPGPSGHEDAVQDWLATRWQPICQELRRSRVNNLLGYVAGSGPRLLLLAHADELCLFVKSITDDGFLHVGPLAADTLGRPPRTYVPLNQPALVVTGNGTVPGYFATASGHVIGGASSQKEQWAWNDWFIELGACSRSEIEALGIYPGCRVICNPPTQRLGPSRIVGKAMDDRGALVINTLAAEALVSRDDLRYEIWIASTVQEENGLIGAASLVDLESFDLCLNIDVGLTGDIPGADPRDFPAKLGAGPTVVYKDNSCHYSVRLSNRLVATARAHDLPVQQSVFQNYGSDGSALIRRGVETALLTYPTRYTHSPIETVDEADLRACVDLIVAFATSEPLPPR